MHCFYGMLLLLGIPGDKRTLLRSVSEMDFASLRPAEYGHQRRVDVRVSIGPGAIAFTLIRLSINSFERPRVKCSTGALEPA